MLYKGKGFCLTLKLGSYSSPYRSYRSSFRTPGLAPCFVPPYYTACPNCCTSHQRISVHHCHSLSHHLPSYLLDSGARSRYSTPGSHRYRRQRRGRWCSQRHIGRRRCSMPSSTDHRLPRIRTCRLRELS